MTISEIKMMLNSSQYDFLRINEHLGKNIILLTFGGSYAYGTNTDTSDVDIRGCALNSKEEILTNKNFEQHEVMGEDFEAIDFWEEYYENYDKITREWEIIGVGNTPNDAVEDLIKKQKEKGLFYGI